MLGIKRILTEKSKYSFTVFQRYLNIQEHVSMSLLRKHGVCVPSGEVAKTPEEAYEACKKLKCEDFVVKAQILAGGRGKGYFKNGIKSGVHLTYSPEEVYEISKNMIGKYLVTKQTSMDGLPCEQVYVCERLFSRREFYIAFTMDRNSTGPLLIGSNKGGVNIEEVAQQFPDSIEKMEIDIFQGLTKERAVNFLHKLGFTTKYVEMASKELLKLYNVFLENECTLLEINPFCETNDGKVISMDCKVQLDDNAKYRHLEYTSYRDFSQEDKLDVMASKYDINYIKLDGTIGCLVNGAGLAMATMDIIKLHGGTPANFLDIGGGADIKQVMTAFNIIKTNPKVRAILVNIFGGIMRCDVIAEGIIETAKSIKLDIPLVVRLQGTKVEEAQALFASSYLKILPVDDLDKAANLVVKLANIMDLAKEVSINVNFELPL